MLLDIVDCLSISIDLLLIIAYLNQLLIYFESIILNCSRKIWDLIL